MPPTTYKNIQVQQKDMRSEAAQAFDQGNPAMVNFYTYGNMSGNASADNRTVNQYLALLDKYHGTEYEQELASLWSAVFQGYNSSGWQDYANSLGIRTGEQDWDINHAQDLQSKINDIESRIREERHNSPGESLAREAAAGLNSDLTGIQNPQVGAASEGDPFALSPLNGAENSQADQAFVAALAALPFQFVQGSVEIISMFQGVSRNKLENALKASKIEENDLDKALLASKLEGAADDWIIKTLAGTQPVWKKNKDGKEIIGDIDTGATTTQLNAVLKAIDVNEIDNPTFRKAVVRAKQRYGSNDNSRTVAVARALAMMQKDTAGSMSDLAQILGNPNFSDDFGKMVQNFSTFYDNTTQKYIDFQNKMRELTVEYQEYVNDYQAAETKYHNKEIEELLKQNIPLKEAAYKAYQLKSQEEFERFMSEQNQSWADMISAIPGHGMWSDIARIVVGALRTQLMEKLNAFNFIPRSTAAPAPANVNISNNMSQPTSMPSQYQAVAGYDW